MKASPQTLLLLSAHHFLAYTWTGDKIVETQHFNNDTEGHAQFSNYLHQHRNPACLLVDLIEEDFRRETVPHLRGRSRRELIERKFEQHYRSTPFRQASVQQRHSDGRRDDEILFSALTNPAQISVWLDILLANHIPVTGVYSLPYLSCGLIKTIKSEHVLLLSWEIHAGLRQSYFKNQHLQFSRLTPLSEHGSLLTTVATEMPRIQQYLTSLDPQSSAEALDVYILCHRNERIKLEEGLLNEPDLHYSYVDIQSASKDVKVEVIFQDSDATPLFLHLLARKACPHHYATSRHTRYHHLWKLRRVLLALASAVTLSTALWSIFPLWDGHKYAARTQALLSQARQLNNQAEDIKQRIPASAISASDMKAAVTLVSGFDNYFPRPEQVLMNLSEALEQFTRIKSNKISWQTSTSNSITSAYPAQLINFDGELLNFGKDYRSALAYLEDFQQSLSQRGYAVSVLNSPLDISPKGSISSKSPSERSSQFTLRLTWRPSQ